MTSPAASETEDEDAVEAEPAGRTRSRRARRRAKGTPGPPEGPPSQKGTRAPILFRERTNARRVDVDARKELAEIQSGRRAFLRKTAIGAGILAIGAAAGYGGGYAQAVGLSGNARTVITDTEIEARIIAGVRIATEFIPDPVPAGTDADPYPGSAIQAALNDGVPVYIPAGTWKLSSTITRTIDNVTIIGAGRSTKLLLDGATPCISAGTQAGWLLANLATDAGGVDVSAGTQCRTTEIWVNGFLTDNRPIGGVSSGTGGYYGVRASDYITTGTGTWTDPWNSTAIQNAINALPRGGIAFIKEGVWGRPGEPRIILGKSPAPQRKIIIQGTGSSQGGYDSGAGGEALSGTQVRVGFDCYYPTDFYDINVGPAYTTQPGITYILDPTTGANIFVWLGGFTVRNVRTFFASPHIWFTGRNFTGTAAPWQIWNAIMDHVHCVGGVGPAFKVDIGDSQAGSNYPGQLNLDIRKFTAQGVASSGTSRTLDVTCGNTRGVWEDFLLEACGNPSVDYTAYLDVGGDNGGLEIHELQFGDGSNSQKDIYLAGGRWVSVRKVTCAKDITIQNARGYFEFASYITSPTVSVLGGKQATFLLGAPGLGTPNITFDGSTDKTKMLVKYWPGDRSGYIGTTSPNGSPYTYTNLDMRNEIVYLVGGTVTGVTRDGQSLGPATTHVLAPGDSIVISYSSAPSIVRYGGS